MRKILSWPGKELSYVLEHDARFMLSLIDKLKFPLSLFLVILSTDVRAQDSRDLAQWDAEWINVLSQEDSSETDKLTELTDLLLNWGKSEGWSSGNNWARVVELLRAWEASPDIEIARDAYLRILYTIGWETLNSGPIETHEEELREFYQRALRITTSPEEEAKLLFHLAVSIYRSESDSLETRRRIEAFLEQASLAAGPLPISADINFLLGSIFAEWGGSFNETDRDEASYYSRAVYHLQQVLSVDGADPGVVEKAQSSLEKLLQSGLELMVENRYHPEDDIRLTVSTRNISEVNVRLIRIPWHVSGMPMTINSLESYADAAGLQATDLILEKVISIDMRNRVDWQESEFRLGNTIASGWYLLSVTGGGESSRSLLLVTRIETVLIPRLNGNLTLWIIDAESGDPVGTTAYHILDQDGRLLFSGTSDANGMAEISTGNDETWTEIHVNHDGNPAFIRKVDLVTNMDPDPWVIPDAIAVYPGDRLGWAIVGPGGSDYPYPGDTRVVLPNGEGLLPLRESSESSARFNVQIPADVEQYGPIYLTLANGKNILFSHLKRSEPLPLEIDLSGERFSPDRNLFFSSAPVSLTIRGRAIGDNVEPGYIRILVEMMQRPASFTGEIPDLDELSEVVFEHITQFGQSSPAEAYWELPDIEQTESPVPIRIKVYPLESDELLGEAYLAMVPFRARVSMTSSERIIPTGGTIMIQIVDVQRGASMTRSPEGELVAFRETWENRYVHRKKGTLLSEEEYNTLPDRSLLGSAKTDYRLLQRGIVREEVLRNRINPVERTRIPIVFERHGFYRIEFEGRDSDVRAHYPDGELEVWVLPESGDLSTFQSEKPRLIVENTGSGEKEILVLMDRDNASILLDLQTADGRSRTRYIKPESSGFYMVQSEKDISLRACRAVITGDRQTDFLCQHIKNGSRPVWDVQMDQSNGLNPGSEFNWDASIQTGSFSVEPVWAIYPEADGELAEDCLNLQRIDHKNVHECEVEAVALNNWLPLLPPIGSVPGLITNDNQPVNEINDLNYIGAVYPELQQESSRKGGFVGFSVISTDSGMPAYQLSGALPMTAGRWCLTSFTPGDQNWISVRSWLFSTELPIRTAITGPPVIRIGDIVSAGLVTENTTRRTLQVALRSEHEGAIQSFDNGFIDIDLPSQQSITLPVVYEAVRAGKGRLTTTVMGSLSSSTAFLNAEVQEKQPVPVFKSYLAREGSQKWQESIDLSGWNSVELIISSGIGGHLSAIWPAVRQTYLQREPLLTQLTDWALEKVKHHHGLIESAPVPADGLLNVLDAYTSESGISWTPGNQPDPWLTSLVLWTIETFSHMSDEDFIDQRERLRNYLESVLISETASVESRIFALRTLAAQANNDPRKRPSRIQAKSFLEFFHGRDQLSMGEAVMLMDVARSFRFIQEVRLLVGYLQNRLKNENSIESLSQWDASLTYLALSQESGEPDLKMKSLQSVVSKAGDISSRSGWEQVGCFLNFLAAFLWEGDFSVDGSVVIKQGDMEAVRVPLKPHGDNAGQLVLSQDDLHIVDHSLQLQMDTSASDQPVIVTVMGKRDEMESWSQYPGQRIHVSREYVEHTLLAGSHVHSVETSLDDSFYPDDMLVERIELDVETSQPYAEFTFMIPAGARLAADDIQYEVNPSSSEAILKDPVLAFLQRQDPLSRGIRIEPLSPGVHVFRLSYHIDYSGTYAFPAHQLIYPKSGEAFRFGTDGLIHVESADQ